MKSFLLAQGKTINEIRDEYGHNVRKLSEKAKEYGLELTEKDEEVFVLMAGTDNVISSRYIRMGTHLRLPLTVYNDLCKSLHIQIEHTAYQDLESVGRPVIWW